MQESSCDVDSLIPFEKWLRTVNPVLDRRRRRQMHLLRLVLSLVIYSSCLTVWNILAAEEILSDSEVGAWPYFWDSGRKPAAEDDAGSSQLSIVSRRTRSSRTWSPGKGSLLPTLRTHAPSVPSRSSTNVISWSITSVDTELRLSCTLRWIRARGPRSTVTANVILLRRRSPIQSSIATESLLHTTTLETRE